MQHNTKGMVLIVSEGTGCVSAATIYYRLESNYKQVEGAAAQDYIHSDIRYKYWMRFVLNISSNYA